MRNSHRIIKNKKNYRILIPTEITAHTLLSEIIFTAIFNTLLKMIKLYVI